MRTMYDSVTVANIPADATMVAGYVNGIYTNVAELKARFPHATVVGISVNARFNAGQVLDVEQYDASPDQAPDWVLMRRGASIDPTIYCSADSWPDVRAAFTSRHLPEPHYWIAHYDGVATLPGGAVAKQYQDAGPYDLSVVADYWPGIDTPQENDMTPEQAAQLADLHKLLVPYAGWDYRGNDAGGGHDTLDVHQQLVNAAGNSGQALTALTEINKVLVQLSAAVAKLAPHTTAGPAADIAAAAAADPIIPAGGAV